MLAVNDESLAGVGGDTRPPPPGWAGNPGWGGLQPSSAFANVQPSCELTAVYDRARLISHWLPLGHLDPSANVQGSWCSLCFNFLVGDSHRFLPNQKHGRIKESSV